MKIIIKTSILAMIIFLSGCGKDYIDIKSPCVSTYNNVQKDPCGPRRPINKWLDIKNSKFIT